MDKRYLTGRVKALNTEERSLTAYASTRDVDRDQDIIEPSAFVNSLQDFSNNAVLLWAHDYRVPPIGRATELAIDDRGLKFKATFADTDFANEIWSLYRDGFLNAFSVGFRPLKWEETEGERGFRFTDVELLEISSVPVPANPHALVERGVPIVTLKSVESIAGVPEWNERLRSLGELSLAGIEAAMKEVEKQQLVNSGEGGESEDEHLSDVAVAERTEPESGVATRDDDATLDTDTDIEPEYDEDALAEALSTLGEILGELTS